MLAIDFSSGDLGHVGGRLRRIPSHVQQLKTVHSRYSHENILYNPARRQDHGRGDKGRVDSHSRLQNQGTIRSKI